MNKFSLNKIIVFLIYTLVAFSIGCSEPKLLFEKVQPYSGEVLQEFPDELAGDFIVNIYEKHEELKVSFEYSDIALDPWSIIIIKNTLNEDKSMLKSEFFLGIKKDSLDIALSEIGFKVLNQSDSKILVKDNTDTAQIVSLNDDSFIVRL